MFLDGKKNCANHTALNLQSDFTIRFRLIEHETEMYFSVYTQRNQSWISWKQDCSYHSPIDLVSNGKNVLVVNISVQGNYNPVVCQLRICRPLPFRSNHIYIKDALCAKTKEKSYLRFFHFELLASKRSKKMHNFFFNAT